MQGVPKRPDRPDTTAAAHGGTCGYTRGVAVFAMRGVAGPGRQIAVAPLWES